MSAVNDWPVLIYYTMFVYCEVCGSDSCTIYSLVFLVCTFLIRSGRQCIVIIEEWFIFPLGWKDQNICCPSCAMLCFLHGRPCPPLTNSQTLYTFVCEQSLVVDERRTVDDEQCRSVLLKTVVHRTKCQLNFWGPVKILVVKPATLVSWPRMPICFQSQVPYKWQCWKKTFEMDTCIYKAADLCNDKLPDLAG